MTTSCFYCQMKLAIEELSELARQARQPGAWPEDMPAAEAKLHTDDLRAIMRVMIDLAARVQPDASVQDRPHGARVVLQ